MQTLCLGSTNTYTSALSLGTMCFGSRCSEALSYQLLNQYVEAGGSFLDTANSYSFWVPGCQGARVPGCQGGESESLLGRWMAERHIRNKILIATKVGFAYPGVEMGLRASQIESECNKSLSRLNVETIDLLYAHVDDRTTPLEETLEALDRLVRTGKVRFIGASNYQAWRLEEALWVSHYHSWSRYCCVQQRYSYVRPQPGGYFDPQIAASREILDYCRTRRITLLAYSPLLGGGYVRADRPFPQQYAGPDTDERVTVLQMVARETGATPNQIVLAWMRESDPPVIPVIGASSKSQLAENLASLEVRLGAQWMSLLNSVRTGGTAW